MKKLLIAILSVLFLAAFIPARYGMLTQVHPDTTWKPYIVVMRDEYGNMSSHYVRGYYNPIVSDTVATGKIARFNFTYKAQNVAGWNDYVFGSWLPWQASDTVTDASSGIRLIRQGGTGWTTSTLGGEPTRIITPDGGGWAFNQSVDTTMWFNFNGVIDSNLNYSTPIQSSFYVTNLDTSKFYKLQILSSYVGRLPPYGPDTIKYSYFLISNQTSVLNNPASNIINPTIYSQMFIGNTSHLITTLYIKPSASYSNGIYIAFGGYGADEANQYGIINAMTITEYKVQTN